MSGTKSAELELQKPPSESERLKFEHCCETIGVRQQDFVEVGEALSKIKTQRLYREFYGNFEEFCRVKFGISRSYAEMSPIGDICQFSRREMLETVALQIPDVLVYRQAI